MEKQPTQDEIKKAILDGMCKAVDDSNFYTRFIETRFTKEDLRKMVPDDVKSARFRLAFDHLLSADNITCKGGSYYLPEDIYEKYVEKQDAENEESEANEESDIWQPIKVEKYEEVAGKIEEFSTAIKAENGLRASHPEETDFVTETADATAKSLRDKEGVITRKRLSTLIDGAYKISKICDATTRIGKVIHAFIEFIRPFL